MVEEFYKISPGDAEKIYKEWIDEDGIHRVVEACNEQDDGTFLLDKSEYEKIKDDVEVKKVDWSKKALITKDEISPKISDIEISGDGGNIVKEPK